MKRTLNLPQIILVALGFCWSAACFAQEEQVASHVSHGISQFGELKYSADFEHFDYVNPDAPKGGRLRLSSIGTFDSFNTLITQGSSAGIGGRMYDTLLIESDDEPGSMYGLLAESVEIPEDYSWVIYTLRENAYFHDGHRITSEDFIFSLNILREKGAPIYRLYYQNVVGAEALDDRRIKFTFDQAGNRELPLITGQMIYALPKHYWEGVDSQGNPRDFGRSTLVPPLGSGPYRIGRFEAGRYTEAVRVPDYWGRDLPVNIGQNNFDTIRVDYYRDDDVELQAFFADEFDLRIEGVARNWATAYDRTVVRDGSIILEEMPFIVPVQGSMYFMNLRREKFQDRRVRQALGLALNFEWLNRNIFYSQYERTDSFWNNSPLASSGLPSEAELELLEPFRDQLPEELFTSEYKPPVSDGTETNRNNLFRALQLMQEAGWQLQNGMLVDSSGNPFEIEFMIYSQSSERVLQPYLRDLEKIGVRGSIRLVDTSQYIERVQNRDFDMFSIVKINTLSPGNEQREDWGSEAADLPGSENYAGIKNPVVDALIEKIIYAPDREALVTATHALDRVLLWNFYTIPAWNSPVIRYAYWDRFGRPDEMPEYHPGASSLSGIPYLWWSKEAEQR